MGVRSICMAVCLVAASYEPAFAQDAEPNMPDKCQVAPQTDSQPTQRDQSSKSPSRSCAHPSGRQPAVTLRQ